MSIWHTSLCHRCRIHSLFNNNTHVTIIHLAQQHLHTTPSRWRQAVGSKSSSWSSSRTKEVFHTSYNRTQQQRRPQQRQKPINPEEVRELLKRSLPSWSKSTATLNRLAIMGMDQPLSNRVLQTFVSQVTPANCFPPEEDKKWQMDRIVEQVNQDRHVALDKALTQRFMAWMQTARDVIPQDKHRILSEIYAVTDSSYPSERYPAARQLRRNIIMHVGPTNSGKTHNALRALAAAENGVYCGPLRLLAHEIYHRLNTGQIAPAGADLTDPPEKHVRKCNLITGEERKVVDPNASLLSCTVEMLNYFVRYRVAVVDEIQMIHDRDRGGGWTAAVLGLNAYEIHLCGEDSVVPLIEAIVQETGDNLIVNRYERLTPLMCAPQSLGGKLSAVTTGDCIIAFTRSGILKMKDKIEQTTGKKCAVAYGRLPPEVRNEQAALFNDRNSGYDVLVGSDAIGMGLNLKIKRIIFQTTNKFDGYTQRALSLSQLKQIAGRAGRFEQTDEHNTPGIVTSLYEHDLPVIRKALAAVVKPKMTRAVLPEHEPQIAAVQALVRDPSKLGEVFEILSYVGRTSDLYSLTSSQMQWGGALAFIDEECAELTLEEKMFFSRAPIPWRDETCAKAVTRFVRMYRDKCTVNFTMALRGSGLLETLEKARQAMTSTSPVHLSHEALTNLESLYKIAIMYLWCSMRMPLAFPGYDDVMQLSVQVQKAIEYCLTLDSSGDPEVDEMSLMPNKDSELE